MDHSFATHVPEASNGGTIPNNVSVNPVPTQSIFGNGEHARLSFQPDNGIDNSIPPPLLDGSQPSCASVESLSMIGPVSVDAAFEYWAEPPQLHSLVLGSAGKTSPEYQDSTEEQRGHSTTQQGLNDIRVPVTGAVLSHGRPPKPRDWCDGGNENDSIYLDLDHRGDGRSCSRASVGLTDRLPSPTPSVESDVTNFAKVHPALRAFRSPSTSSDYSSGVRPSSSTPRNTNNHGQLYSCESCPILFETVRALAVLPTPPVKEASRRVDIDQRSQKGTCKMCTIFLDTISSLASLRNALLGGVSSRARRKLPPRKRTSRRILRTEAPWEEDFEDVPQRLTSSVAEWKSDEDFESVGRNAIRAFDTLRRQEASKGTRRVSKHEEIEEQRRYNLRNRNLATEQISEGYRGERMPSYPRRNTRMIGVGKNRKNDNNIRRTNKRKQTVGERRRWTRSEEENLKTLKETGSRSRIDIAKELGRSLSAVDQQWRKMVLEGGYRTR